MRRVIATASFLLILSPLYAASANAEIPERLPKIGSNLLYGKAPNSNVKNWIRLILLGPRNGPSPIFLISPTTFKVDDLQTLIPLSRKQYNLFAQYTRANQCEQSSGDYRPSQVLEATEHAGIKTTILCRMSLSATCRYISGIMTIPRIGWMEQKWEPLRKVNTGFGCK